MGQKPLNRWIFVTISMVGFATMAFGQDGYTPRDVYLPLTPCGLETTNEELIVREAFEFNPGDRLLAIMPEGTSFTQHTFSFTRGWNQPWGDSDYPVYVNAGVAASGQALVWIQDLYDTYGEDLFQRPFIRVAVVIPDVYLNQRAQCGLYFYRGDGSDAEVNSLIRQVDDRFFYVGEDITQGASGGTWIGNGINSSGPGGSPRVGDGVLVSGSDEYWGGSSSGSGLELGNGSASQLTALRVGQNRLNSGGCELRAHSRQSGPGGFASMILALTLLALSWCLRRRTTLGGKSL